MTISISAYALLAANSYGLLSMVRSEINTLSLPPGEGWTPIKVTTDPVTGFMAAAYQDANGEIVIAYAGTTAEDENKWGDWWSGNVPAAAGLPSPQVCEAARFYMDVISMPSAAGCPTSFTGHSLGGGLASLMAEYFDKQALVFDEAPFQKSADSLEAVAAVQAYLLSPLQQHTSESLRER